MRIYFGSPTRKLFGVACLAMLVFNGLPLLGSPWQNDIQFASQEWALAHDGEEADIVYIDDSSELTFEACSRRNCGSSPTGELKAWFAAAAKSMQEQGITYAPGLTQFYQGVTEGGVEQTFEYGGKVDQLLILDGGKLGVKEGFSMTLHAETRFGDDVNLDAVGLAPVNVAMLYPKEGEHVTAITNLTFSQYLSDDVQATVGKLNALDMFYGMYPQIGRGVDGFMNASMVIPLAIARVASLSFMGAGVTKYHGKLPQAGILVYDTNNVPTTSGFEDLFDNGVNIMGFWRFFYDTNGLPGSQTFGSAWSTGEFVSFDPTGFAIVPGQGLVAPRESGAWSLFYVYEQTIWADGCNKNRNVGVISQLCLSDEQTSPFKWSANVGIQAQGLNGCRPKDSAGIGYFHSGLSDDFVSVLQPLIPLHDINGVELYYNASIADCFSLTTDLQVIDPAEIANDTAVVFGIRGNIGF